MKKFIRYIRKEDRTPVGVLVGFENGAIGMSLCNPKDNFNKKLGRKIAEDRAHLNDPLFPVMSPFPNRKDVDAEYEFIAFDNMIMSHVSKD